MSNLSYIPEGFHTVTPYFVVPDGTAFLAFLKSAFGAEQISIYKDPGGGRIMHAQIRVGDSILEFGEASPQFPAMKLSLHAYFPDTDAVYRQAVAAGAKTLREPRTEVYGERSAGIEDPAGNVWWLATRVENVSDEEIARRMKA
jgi:uncharacterized glyoxalase superfamily protein PhnB